jgi:hypothetical protein
VKLAYDIGTQETAPYLAPLRDVTEKEIKNAEDGWSDWLAMQDWMVPCLLGSCVTREDIFTG